MDNFNIEDFCQNKGIFKRGTDKETVMDNSLSIDQQKRLINNIYDNCYVISVDGKKEMLLDLGDGNTLYIERNYKNFSTIIKLKFKSIMFNEYELINLPKLFEVIKSKKVFLLKYNKSIFNEKNYFEANLEEEELIKYIKINYDFNIDGITRDEFDEIWYAISKHWNNYINLILDHIVAGMFTSDKKNLWFLILADSNFGKSKLFKWIEPFGGSVFIDFEDLTTNGINNRSPNDFEGRGCLVVDETTTFPRKLFKIEDYLLIREMRNHSVKVSINSRYLLSADGGVFNNEYMDKQIINRVSVMDLRSSTNLELGELDVVKKYGQKKIQIIMTYLLYKGIEKRLEEYKKLDIIEQVNKADKIIKTIFNKFKQIKDDFFRTVERSLYEILNDFRESLDDRHSDMLNNALVRIDNVTQKGFIIKRSQDIIPKILSNYDKSLEYELQFKTVKQIADTIKGFKIGSFKINKKTVRGLFIPDRVITTYIDIDNEVTDRTFEVTRNNSNDCQVGF